MKKGRGDKEREGGHRKGGGMKKGRGSKEREGKGRVDKGCLGDISHGRSG
jgi:hypothetical protein